VSKLTPHYYKHRKRLRERFERVGLRGFSEHEVLELVLTLAIPRKDVKVPAKELLARFGSLKAVLDAPAQELQQVHGLGSVAPIVVRIIRDVSTLYLQERVKARPQLLDLDDLARFWRSRIGGLSDEVFEVAYLDTSYRLMRDGVETLSKGTIDRAVVYPRTVMEAALRRKAAAVVLAHNHPDGDVTPSSEDKDLTRALVLAAATLQVKIHDHIVVSADKVLSFRQEGLL